MRAAVIVDKDGRRRLEVADDLPEPVPGEGEILVRVEAAGLNRADLAMPLRHRHGTGATGPAIAGPAIAGPAIAGNEFAGTVAALGPGADRFAPGDRVMGFGASAFAEMTAVNHRHVFPVPDGMGWRDAAALPVAVETMHDAVVTNGRLAPGESVLFLGAGSGVGIVGMQIAKAKGAARVFGASRSRDRLDRLAAFGMDDGIDVSDPGWPDRVRALTGGRGVALIVDMVSGAGVNAAMRAAAVRGRIVNVGRLGGMTGAFDFDLHALKRLDYIGVTFRTRSDEEIAAIVDRAWADLGPAIEAGAIAVPLHAAFPLEAVAEAYAEMRRDTHLGKIAILP